MPDVRFEKNGGEDDDQDILHNASNNEGHAARMLHDSCSTDLDAVYVRVCACVYHQFTECFCVH